MERILDKFSNFYWGQKRNSILDIHLKMTLYKTFGWTPTEMRTSPQTSKRIENLCKKINWYFTESFDLLRRLLRFWHFGQCLPLRPILVYGTLVCNIMSTNIGYSCNYHDIKYINKIYDVIRNRMEKGDKELYYSTTPT